MAEFRIEIAGTVFSVSSLFDSTKDYCQKYLTEKEPEHHLAVFREDLVYEQEQLDIEAREEGMKRRKFTDPFLERTAIQRKAAEILFQKGVLLFHGSGIALEGKGYLFTAACGTGKSTHTRFWRETLGAVAVNNDKPFLMITDKGVVMYGAPWSGKHGLDTNTAVPLMGICILERGPENRIFPVTPEEAMDMLLHQGCAPAGQAHRDLTQQLARSVSLWRMECTKDPAAAAVAMAAMHK